MDKKCCYTTTIEKKGEKEKRRNYYKQFPPLMLLYNDDGNNHYIIFFFLLLYSHLSPQAKMQLVTWMMLMLVLPTDDLPLHWHSNKHKSDMVYTLLRT